MKSPAILLLPLLLSACATTGSDAGADTLFHNGSIRLSPELEPVEWVLVRDRRVIAAGEGEALGAEGARRVDLRGGYAVPGLQDAHGHVSGLGDALESVDLVGCTSYAEVIERIRAQAAEQPAGSWVTGRGWDQTRWPENAFPHHEELSRAVPEHPVLVRRVDGHAALANRRALEIAGLMDADPMPEVEGGRVVVGDDGRPTGVLIDTAMGLVGGHVPDADEGDLRRRLLLAQDALLALGLVGVHDMGISPQAARVMERLEEEGLLRMRIVAYLWANEGLAPEVAARYPRDADHDAARHLRVIGCKLMMDGALGSRGAALLEPYADAAGEIGLLRMDEAAFRSVLDQVADAGLQPATHAIGDRANRIVLDAYAARADTDPAFARLRPRIEHAQVVSAADWERFDALGVIPSMQPTHATSDMRWAEERVGAARVEGAYAWRRLSPATTSLAFGSDFPVEHPSPLDGLYAARTRMDKAGAPDGGWFPEQRMDGGEALAGFTIGVARAAREERERGKLLPGYFCDMTVLDVDPVTCDPADLLTAEVLMTVVDGVVVYDSSNP